MFTLNYQPGALELAVELFGRAVSDEELAAAAGALDGATLHVRVKQVAELFIEVEHPWIARGVPATVTKRRLSSAKVAQLMRVGNCRCAISLISGVRSQKRKTPFMSAVTKRRPLAESACRFKLFRCPLKRFTT